MGFAGVAGRLYVYGGVSSTGSHLYTRAFFSTLRAKISQISRDINAPNLGNPHPPPLPSSFSPHLFLHPPPPLPLPSPPSFSLPSSPSSFVRPNPLPPPLYPPLVLLSTISDSQTFSLPPTHHLLLLPPTPSPSLPLPLPRFLSHSPPSPQYLPHVSSAVPQLQISRRLLGRAATKRPLQLRHREGRVGPAHRRWRGKAICARQRVPRCTGWAAVPLRRLRRLRLPSASNFVAFLQLFVSESCFAP